MHLLSKALWHPRRRNGGAVAMTATQPNGALEVKARYRRGLPLHVRHVDPPGRVGVLQRQTALRRLVRFRRNAVPGAEGNGEVVGLSIRGDAPNIGRAHFHGRRSRRVDAQDAEEA